MIAFSVSGEIGLGVDPEEYRLTRNQFIRTLIESLGDNDYGLGIEKIFMGHMIFNPEEGSLYKERRHFKKAKKVADYRLVVPFEEWQGGDREAKAKLLAKSLVVTVSDLGHKLKNDFDGLQLQNDIKALFDI